ncbi:hypothetical protein DENSPDRAFT_884637 [Dentipellis sp. KUC8613]|nr:hypothetical protein DENSPDRAFT_884637 [Dentipellis sp. KUC8613]
MSQASSNGSKTPAAGKSATVRKLKQFEKTPPDLGVMFKADVENIRRQLKEEKAMSSERRRQLESQLQTLLDLIAATAKKK